MRLQSVGLSRYQIRLLPGTAPLDEREGALLFWRVQDGHEVVSEMAPLPGFSAETLSDCISACRRFFADGGPAATQRLAAARQAANDEDAAPALDYLPPAARFALEAGWMELSHPPLKTPSVSTCRLMGPDQSRLDGPVDQCVKVKVGRAGLEADIERLRQLLNQLPAAIRLRLDANRSWTLEQAARLCAVLPPERIEFIEEPLLPGSSYADWPRVSGIPYALDETLREQPASNLQAPGLGAIVLKPMLTGLSQSMRWMRSARQCRRQVVLSAAFESNITLDFYARLARFWRLRSVPGLDTFSAWPEALLTPLRSQPGHQHKPVRPRAELITEPPLL